MKKMNRIGSGLEFEANLRWDGETGGEVNIGEFPTLKLDMPIKFGGKSRHPCPDELFLSSIAGYLLTTFLYFKSKLNIRLEGLEIHISGTLSTGTEGYRMAGIQAILYVEAKKDYETDIKRCIELTKKYCHITRTLEKAIPVRIIERTRIVTEPNSS